MTIADRIRPSFSALDSMFFARAGIVVLGLLLLAVVVSRVVYPFDAGNVEALSWIPAAHLLAGENPYSFAVVPPYSMSPYGVVYYALLGVGVKFFGYQIWFGRILSVCGFAVCVRAAAKITGKLTANRAAVLVTVLAGLAMFPTQMWIALMRADLIAAAFAAAALCLALTLDERDEPTAGRLIAMLLLVALAFFTKHTFSLPAGFIFLRFWQIGKRRAAFFFAVSFAALVAAGIFLLDYTSSGGYTWQHFVHARRLPVMTDNLLSSFPASPKRLAFLFFLIFLAFFLGRRLSNFGSRGIASKRARTALMLRSPRFLIFLYFAASLAAAFASSARVGANVNYYIENSFSAAIICGLLYDWFRRANSVRLSYAIIFLLTLGGALQLAQIARGEYFRWQSVGYYREVFERTGQILAREPNAVCVSVSPEIVIRNGCALEYDDIAEYDGGWAPELKEIFETRMKSGRYAAVLWHDENLRARFPNYRLVPMRENPPSRFFPVYLYERGE